MTIIGVSKVAALEKSEERREYRRVSDAIALSLQPQDEAANEQEFDADDLPEHPTHVVSLSPNGLKCFHTEAFNDGDTLQASIRLFPSGDRIDTLVKVVNSGEEKTGKNERFFAGLSFVKLSDDNSSLLLEHIDQVARQSFGGAVKLVNR